MSREASSSSPDDGIKRGGKMALLDAKAEQALRGAGAPIRCCDFWPECSHILAWWEKVNGGAADA